MKRKLTILTILVVLVIVVLAWRTLTAAGVFTALANGPDLDCTRIPGAPGAEDMVLDRAKGLVYVSSFDRRKARQGSAKGALYRFSLEDPAGTLTDITPTTLKRFAPHGISLYTAPGGVQTLYVVNHATTLSEATDLVGRGQVVEVFTLVPGKAAQHRKTVSDPSFVSLNDVQAVDENRFYVTNDHGSEPGRVRVFEEFALLGLANVVYFDGAGVRTVASGLTYANGLALSPGGATLYVTETTGRALLSYAVEDETGALKLTRRLPLAFGLDNIDVDSSGMLWITGHPKLYDFVAHAADGAHPSPSQVVTVTLTPSGEAAVDTRFMDKGTLLSGASIAVADQGKMFVGSVFEADFLVCDLS